MKKLLEVKFGRKSEPSSTFKKCEDLIAVRTRSTRSLMANSVRSANANTLNEGKLILDFPEKGMEVYQFPASEETASIDARKSLLRQIPDVRFAGGGIVDEQTGEPVVYTENLFIKFVDTASIERCEDVIREAGLAIKRRVHYAANSFFVGAPEGTGTAIFEKARELLKRDDVEYCHPEIVRRRHTRAISDRQWHLREIALSDGTIVKAHASVDAAHVISQGAGVTIAIIDDGVDIDHPEFTSPGKIVSPRDIGTASANPRPVYIHPREGDNHGTACAGVACADGTSNGASGVAPKAKLMPIRLGAGLGAQEEADAFIWAVDHGADVISCSWGPADGDWSDPNDSLHSVVHQLPANVRLALDYAVQKGRGGKGCIVLFAAGNGNESVDNDGYASYAHVIAVAACNDRGTRSIYSDYGDAIWCSFPSNDFEFGNHPAPLTRGIWTTDWTDGTNGRIRGYLSGNYTDRFGGTSSACPGVAGVCALILSVNPHLRSQDVRRILASACEVIDPQGGAYTHGRSKFYGYGRINALHAVQQAAQITSNTVSIVRNFKEPLPDLQTVEITLNVTESQPVEEFSAEIEIAHSYVGDLIVTLHPPDSLGGDPFILHNRAGLSGNGIKQKYDAVLIPGLSRLKGKTVSGTWTLRVKDTGVRDEGTLVKFGVELALAQSSARTLLAGDNFAPSRNA